MTNQAALRLVVKEDGEKQRTLEAALTQIDRAFGKGAVTFHEVTWHIVGRGADNADIAKLDDRAITAIYR